MRERVEARAPHRTSLDQWDHLLGQSRHLGVEERREVIASQPAQLGVEDNERLPAVVLNSFPDLVRGHQLARIEGRVLIE